jgi:hypothetical protein
MPVKLLAAANRLYPNFEKTTAIHAARNAFTSL